MFRLFVMSLVLSAFFLQSCKFNSDLQREGADYLQGVWVQDSIPYQDQLNQYTLHEFKFTCDSIYTTFRVHSKVRTIPDTCFNGGQWTEYAKAVYVIRGDSLIGDGLYTKENWKQKISGCYQIGQYLPRFKIVSYSEDTLILESRFDQNQINLRKTQDITCVPKRRYGRE